MTIITCGRIAILSTTAKPVETMSYKRVVEAFTDAPEYLGVKYFREKILEVLEVLAVFGLRVLRDTVSNRSISRFCTANTAKLTVF